MTKQTLTQSLANPTRFMWLSGALLPWITVAAILVLTVGLVWTFRFTPPDYQHKETVTIMFVHVPAAWIGMGCYMLIAISSAGLLIWRHPLADVSAKAAAPVGAAFTLVCLITGSLWGMPGWGTYWEWDARLTSVLLLFFLYLGLIALRTSIEDESLAAKLTAILGIVGVVLLPVIKFSVDWWWTLHQKASVMTLGEQKVHWSIRAPLLVMAFGFLLAFIAMHLKGMRNEILRRRLKAIRVARVAQEHGAMSRDDRPAPLSGAAP